MLRLSYRIPANSVVALSGGADSVALALLCERYGLSFRCVHIEHHADLSSEMVAEASSFVQVLCVQRNWHLTVFKVSPDRAIAKQKGWEEASRLARLEKLQSSLGEDETLLFGHHADDQAETVLFRILRGTGILGLGGIPVHCGTTRGLRPLLHTRKSEILEFLSEEGIPWFEDVGNANTHFTRNRIRSEILPLLQEQFPGIVRNLVSLSAHATEASELLLDLAELDYSSVKLSANCLCKEKFKSLSVSRQKNLLRYLLKSLAGCTPSASQLDELHKRARGNSDALVSLWVLRQTATTLELSVKP